MRIAAWTVLTLCWFGVLFGESYMQGTPLPELLAGGILGAVAVLMLHRS